MPEICNFFGISINIYYDDHNPPHFHAEYGEFRILVEIDDFSVLKGFLSPRALGLVMEWALIHKSELMEEWKLAKDNKALFKIKPLI